MPRKADPAGIVAQVLASPKYRHLDETLVRRVAGEAADRFRDHNEAVRYARRKLHQAFGAFLTGEPAAGVRGCIDAIGSGADVREACLTAMRAHASTAERIAWLEPFYAQVSAWTGPVSSVVDLACGLNPLALPWLRVEPGARYWCCDIDRELVAALGGLGTVFPVEVRAQTCDLLSAPSLPAADLALVLKTLTTLEQQRAGAAAAVLATLDAPHVVLSLPRRSLGARRSYVDDPLATVSRAIEATKYRVTDRAGFGDELLYHLVPA